MTNKLPTGETRHEWLICDRCGNKQPFSIAEIWGFQCGQRTRGDNRCLGTYREPPVQPAAVEQPRCPSCGSPAKSDWDRDCGIFYTCDSCGHQFSFATPESAQSVTPPQGAQCVKCKHRDGVDANGWCLHGRPYLPNQPDSNQRSICDCKCEFPLTPPQGKALPMNDRFEAEMIVGSHATNSRVIGGVKWSVTNDDDLIDEITAFAKRVRADARATPPPTAEADVEIRRIQDGIRDHLIALGAPDSMIDGAGCDSGDPLDFTKAEITQAFNYFDDQRAATVPTADYEAVARERLLNSIVELAKGAIRQTEVMRKVGRSDDELNLLCELLDQFDRLIETEIKPHVPPLTPLSTAARGNKSLYTCACGDVFNESFRGMCPNCVATEVSAARGAEKGKVNG